MEQKTFVIAIAGTSAAGKTTVVKHLTAQYENAAYLLFDDYEDEDTYPASFESFIEQDYDVNLFKSEKFAKDIIALKAGQAITVPNSESALEPPRLLFLEEPTGRTRQMMQSLIDCVIWLDVPYDIALARRILRTADNLPEPQAQAESIVGFVQWYIAYGGSIYKNIGEQVKAQSDLVVDGLKSTEEIVASIKMWLKTKHSI